MFLIDTINNMVEKVDNVSLSALIERQNTTYNNLFFDEVSILSLNELVKLHEEDLIDDTEFQVAKADFDKLQGSELFADIKCFVFVDREKKREIKIFPTQVDSDLFACEEVENMINDYTGDIEINCLIKKSINDLLDYLVEVDNKRLFDEVKYFIEQMTSEPKQASSTELAEYLGVTKGAVSQYDKTKKDLMLKGLGVIKKFGV